MVEYTIIKDGKIWNQEILKFPNFNPYQIFEWGEYKKEMGWKVASIKANNNGDIGYLQITYKIKFNIFLGWCTGSISGNISSFAKDEFIKFLQSQFGIKYVFIKSSFTNILDFNESIALYSAGWEKSCTKLSSDYTTYVDLTKSMDELLNSCSTNFRKNVKRGREKNLEINIKKLNEYSEESISALFERFKIIKDVPLPDINEIKNIKKFLSNNIMIATSVINDEIVGLRAFLYHEDKALDFWATTDLIGRKYYTSYMLLFELFQKAKKMGIKKYDMTGIDPLKNPTVFGFKNGLRADNVEKLGAWDLTNSNVISFLINKIYL